MAHAPRATIDFESRSACPIRTHGSWRYSLDPTTEVLCLAFRLPTWRSGDVALWHPAFPHLDLPESADRLDDLLLWIIDGGLVEAHNAFFERGIWTNIMGPRYGWPAILPEQWRDSAAKAAAHALPRSLDDAADALGLSITKDLVGAKAMKKMVKPRKPRKKERETWAKDPGNAPMPLLWWESPELFTTLFEYCKQDIRAEEALSAAVPDLSPAEQEVYCVDQITNERGFRLDRQAVHVAETLLSSEQLRLNEEIAVITGGAVRKATQRAKLSAWCAANGKALENTTAETIDAYLEWPQLPELIRRALTVLRALGRSSTAKYEAMARWICHDGRAHGGLLYHAASTGRWGGQGIQPQNFPKGSLDHWDMNDAWEILLTGDLEFVRVVFSDVMAALAQALRGAIIPADGRALYVADYSGIEARVLAWLSEDDEALTRFRNDEDPYIDMAISIYGRPITKADKDERQLGKAAVLGCFGADTLVLTDRGWVQIANVRLTDRVWDGVEWVGHEGISYQGEQEVREWLGITVTPEHQIWTGRMWASVALLERSENIQYQQSALATAMSSLLASCTAHEAAFLRYRFGACAEPSPPPLHPTCSGGAPLGVIAVQSLQPVDSARPVAATLTSSPIDEHETGSWTASAPSSVAAIRSEAPHSTITADAESPSTGRTPPRADENFFSTLCRFPDGRIRTWKSIVPTTTETTRRAISVSSHGVRTCPIAATWDVVNAGPRSRYTVLTAQGPLIVHNCGYQMGGPRFVDTAATYGVTIDEAFACKVVEAYRTKYRRAVDMWKDQEFRAMQAVWNPGMEINAGRVTWIKQDRYLYCVLPSGRRLAYPDPEVRKTTTSWGARREQLTFMGVSSTTHQWGRQPTYGGMLTENITQAVARDLMAAALVRCHKSERFAPVLSVHDELVAEGVPGLPVKDFETLVATSPAWARGLPVKAEGWSGFRYRK